MRGVRLTKNMKTLKGLKTTVTTMIVGVDNIDNWLISETKHSKFLVLYLFLYYIAPWPLQTPYLKDKRLKHAYV